MKRSTSLALAAAIGVGAFASTANAEDFGREFDQIASQRAGSDDGVRMRLSLPFGEAEADRRDPSLSFGFTQSLGGQARSFDMFTFSLNGSAPRLETPLTLNAAGDGDGGWFSKPVNWLILGAGVGVAWAIYDHNQDDDDPAPPPVLN